MKNLAIIILFSFITFSLSAQRIAGKVQDSKTLEALPFVNVYLNNTTIGTVTDGNGEFNLSTIKELGTYELVFSLVGYETYKVKVTIGEGPMKIGIVKLIPSEIKLSNVEVTATRDKQWEKKLKKFKKVFLGEDKQAASCRIINPWVIDFPPDERGKKFLASASAPIEIVNEALGYKIFYFLTDFWSEANTYLIKGNIQFKEIEAIDEIQLLNWTKNRAYAYRKSYNYFFHSIRTKNSRGKGFTVYGTNKNQKSKIGFGNWVPFDTTSIVSLGDHSGEFTIAMKGEFEIHSLKKWDVSRFNITGDHVKINRYGFVLNPMDIKVSGSYDRNRVASLLPITYQAGRVIAGDAGYTYAQDMERFYEKIYVHTDKPYYYPGEPMWFKGYIRYKEPAWRDSLSKVVYVELINPKKEITLTKALKIDSGFFHNDFILPDTLKEGTYYLRAYTNLNRNFGDSTLFVKPIPILNITDKVDHTQGQLEATENSLLTITSDKKIYKTRERITLTMIVKGKEGDLLAANLSVSVTDAIQVVPIAEDLTILNGYALKIEKQPKATELKYPVEQGLGFGGKFVNDKGKPEKTTLTIFQMQPRNIMLATSNSQGLFSITGYDFYDSTTFSFKADGAKEYPYGKVELQPREIPPINFKKSNYNVLVQNTESQQRIISEYEVPKGAKMLEEIVVKGKKMEKNKPFRSYSYPDHIIQGKDINQIDILYTLAHLPGIFVEMMTKRVLFTRAMTQSINFGGTPLVTIDDVPMAGQSAGELLSSIDPSRIESIEITKRLNPLYGSLGANGVIAIYLKQGISDEDFNIAPNFQLLRIQGYSPSRLFRYPDYGDPRTDTTSADYRSTIYWNPEIVTDSKTGTATVSFYAADLPGRYRVVAEGVARNGEPVRCVQFVEVEGN